MSIRNEINFVLNNVLVSIESKEVIIFGLNGHIDEILYCLQEKKIKVLAIFDNSIIKIGTYYKKIPVVKPTKKYNDTNLLVLIASRYYYEMKEQLTKLGYSSDNIIKLIDDSNGMHLHEDDLSTLKSTIIAGKEVHDNIVNSFAENTFFNLAPVSSIGDVYLFSVYWDSYINNCKEKNVLVLTGNSSSYLASKIGITNTISLNIMESNSLCKYLQLKGFNNSKFKLLHTGYIHTSVRSRLLTTLNLTWLEHYRILFDLPTNTPKLLKQFIPDEKEFQSIIKKYNIKENKTIILSPYTNTIPELDNTFWIYLSKDLSNKGYYVLTNVVGDEKPILGTNPIEFPLDFANKIIDFAGHFIALRNGLCDIICSSKAKKIIIYPDLHFDNISVYDFYSFNHMQIGNNVIEIINKNNDYHDLVNKIIKEGNF